MTNRRNFIKSTAKIGAGFYLASLLSAFKGKGNYPIGVFDISTGLQKNIPELFDLCKKVGLDGIQFTGNVRDSRVVDEYLSHMKRTGLKAAASCLAFDYESPDGVANLCKSIDGTLALGTDTMLIAFFGDRTLKMENRYLDKDKAKLLIPALKEVVPYAKEKNVCICMEGELCADDNKYIVDAVGSEFFKIYYDIKNIEACGFSAPADIRALKGYIKQLHLKCAGDKLYDTPMPKNMDETIQAILDIDYDNWLVFESDGKVPNAEEYLAKNLEYVRNTKFFK